MFRYFIGAVACALVMVGAAAGDPPKNQESGGYTAPTESVYGVASPAAKNSSTPSATSLAGRKKVEALLQAPANLDFGGRDTVTLGELLDQLHEKQGLSVRFDMPTLNALIPGMAALSMSSVEAAIEQMTPHAEKAASGATSEKEPKQQATEHVAATAPTEGASHGVESTPNPLTCYLRIDVKIKNMDLKHLSVATVLRHALDAMPSMGIEEMVAEGLPMPITVSNACLLDYVVESDGLMITTRMNALTVKETRVYSLKHLKDCKAEEVAKVIRLTVRPWSWRSQINDLGDQLRAGTHDVAAHAVASIVQTGLQVATPALVAEGASIPTQSCPGGACAIPTTSTPTITIAPSAPGALATDPASVAQLVDAGSNSLVALAQASLAGLEMIHFADPPTGVIQTLPGRLIVTQSQAAHREIAELLQQLAEE